MHPAMDSHDTFQGRSSVHTQPWNPPIHQTVSSTHHSVVYPTQIQRTAGQIFSRGTICNSHSVSSSPKLYYDITSVGSGPIFPSLVWHHSAMAQGSHHVRPCRCTNHQIVYSTFVSVAIQRKIQCRWVHQYVPAWVPSMVACLKI